MIDALETCDADHYKVYINDALRNVLNSLLLSILKAESGFESHLRLQ